MCPCVQTSDRPLPGVEANCIEFGSAILAHLLDKPSGASDFSVLFSDAVQPSLIGNSI